jgi:hypothetical protein
MTEYYLMSVKHSRGDHVSLWRKNKRGYTYFLENAGTYSQDEVTTGELAYHVERGAIILIPVEIAEEFARRTIPVECCDSFGRGFKLDDVLNRAKAAIAE